MISIHTFTSVCSKTGSRQDFLVHQPQHCITPTSTSIDVYMVKTVSLSDLLPIIDPVQPFHSTSQSASYWYTLDQYPAQPQSVHCLTHNRLVILAARLPQFASASFPEPHKTSLYSSIWTLWILIHKLTLAVGLNKAPKQKKRNSSCKQVWMCFWRNYLS